MDIATELFVLFNLAASATVFVLSIVALQGALARYTILTRLGFIIIPIGSGLSMLDYIFGIPQTQWALLITNVGILFILARIIDHRKELNAFAYVLNDVTYKQIGIVGKTVLELEFLVSKLWKGFVRLFFKKRPKLV